MMRSYSAGSTASPLSTLKTCSTTSSGRGRLPTCVVRIRPFGDMCSFSSGVSASGLPDAAQDRQRILGAHGPRVGLRRGACGAERRDLGQVLLRHAVVAQPAGAEQRRELLDARGRVVGTERVGERVDRRGGAGI